MTLPSPPPEGAAHSERVVEAIRAEIRANSGWISFARYMELALYAPGLGYYMAGARKLGPEGDFVTAPEISPLFGRTLARQARQVLDAGYDEVLEVGAGSGALAATLLEELERSGAPPRNYYILELSPDLRERSRDLLAQRVPHLLERVAWLNRLPPQFSGLAIGNEVLDAMPAHVIERSGDSIDEWGVGLDGGRLQWARRAASGEIASSALALPLPFASYRTEIHPAACGFIRSLAEVMERGVAIFIDYGFPAREYYHPQRASGTLMCHYRHRAHDDPFFLPGLQDVTSHIDFSAIAAAAHQGGLEVLGYSSQAQFLVNCGITDILGQEDPSKAGAYLPLSNQADKLLSPAEMGELFKVIALGRGFDAPLLGFASGDRLHTL